jgi:hypothetical protein
MSTVFLYPKTLAGECFKSEFRIIKSLDVNPSELKPLEIIIDIDYSTGETLVGRPLLNKTTKYEGRLYEKLLTLKLPHDGALNEEEKEKILKFVSNYGSPIGNSVSLQGQLINSHGAEINWAFILYTIDLEQGGANFFSSFRNMYVDFVGAVEIIKSGKLELLNNYKGTFDIGLEGNKLILPSYPLNEINRLPKWISNTSLNLCYLELYELLSSNQQIKTCKYCGTLFESSKSNELRCNNCKNPSVYRKLYYTRNNEEEKEKAKNRMKKLRAK